MSIMTIIDTPVVVAVGLVALHAFAKYIRVDEVQQEKDEKAAWYQEYEHRVLFPKDF